MRRDGVHELTCAGELHGRKLDPADTIFKRLRRQTGCSTAARTLTSAATRAPGGAHTRSTTSAAKSAPPR
jgi:hypothetical protein